jgi:threonine/homoserine/homoserine lactone efflux protein
VAQTAALMISLHSFLLFVTAVVVLVLLPGPDMAYMLARTVAQGRRAGLVAAIGINAGAYFHVIAAVLGLSAVLATSSTAFTAVKLAGAGYLIWIGIRAIASRSDNKLESGPSRAAASCSRIFWEGFLSDALNPKVAIFFLAFLPQFVNRSSDVSVPMQLLFLGVTSNVIAIAINVCLVVLAGTATRALRENTAWKKGLSKLAGGLFIALGLRLAGEKL